MNRILSLPIILLCFFSYGCDSGSEMLHERVNGVLWRQTSVEFKIATKQIYSYAKILLEKAIVESDNSLEWTSAVEQTASGFKSYCSSIDNISSVLSQVHVPAIIMDLDETVFDNSVFQSRLIKSGGIFRQELWDEWVNEKSASAIPGATDFIEFAEGKGIKIIYVTNRKNGQPTVENLFRLLKNSSKERYGYNDKNPLEGQPVAMANLSKDVYWKNKREGWGSDKTSRRCYLVQHYRILLIIGDDYHDFVYLGKNTLDERIKKSENYRRYWQDKWVLIPNDLYGSWDESLYNFDRNLSRKEELNRKNLHLSE